MRTRNEQPSNQHRPSQNKMSRQTVESLEWKVQTNSSRGVHCQAKETRWKLLLSKGSYSDVNNQSTQLNDLKYGALLYRRGGRANPTMGKRISQEEQQLMQCLSSLPLLFKAFPVVNQEKSKTSLIVVEEPDCTVQNFVSILIK